MAGSPWGEIQHSYPLVRGMRLVSTAGHGGVMVTKGFAKKHLSEAAIRRGFPYGGHLCYEEDCDASIPIFEVKACWEKIKRGRKDYNPEESLLQSLSAWHPEYLLEMGVTPLEPYYSEAMKRMEEWRMRGERHPDLIISAQSDEFTGIPGVIAVTTADDKVHFVYKEAYKPLQSRRLSVQKEYVVK